MEKLYIANCTRQNFILNVRVPEGKVMRIDIPSGHQVHFPTSLNPDAKEHVLHQLHRYGGRPRADVRGKLENFTGIVYSLDKPISEDEIVGANEDQLDAAQTRSVEQATRSALASDLANRESQKGSGRRKRKAKSTGVSVVRKDSERHEEPMMDIEITDEANQKVKLPGVK